MKIKYLYFALLAAIFIGGIFGISKLQWPFSKGNATDNATNVNATNKTGPTPVVLSGEEVGGKALKYINEKILIPQGVLGEVESIEGYGDYLYTVNLVVKQGGQIQGRVPVYVTKDGKMILIERGNIIDLLKEEDIPRAPVSADDDPYLGPKDAKVTVIEFSDFQCVYCSAVVGKNDAMIARLKSNNPSWEAPVPRLEELARQGKIKFVFRDFPLDSLHPSARKAAEAAQCANEQGKFWEMHDKLFEGQSRWSGGNATEIFKEYAVGLGLNKAQFDDCSDSGKYAAEVQKDYQAATSLGLTGTPSFFVNGINVKGAASFNVLEQIINAELSGGTTIATNNSEGCTQ